MTMKTSKSRWVPLFWSLAILLTTSVVITGCKKDKDPDITPELTVPATIGILKAGGPADIQVACNMKWTVTDETADKSWYTLSTTEGEGNGTVVFTATANTASGNRTATLTFTAGTLTKQTVVTQDPGDKTLDVSPASLTAAYAGEAKQLAITSNVAWTATSTATWIMLNPASGNNNGTVTVTASASTVAEARIDTITIKSEGLTDRKVVVEQAPAPGMVNVSPASLEFNNRGEAKNGNKTVTLTSNGGWTASSNDSWIDLSAASGTFNGTLTVTLNEWNKGLSARTATVSVVTADHAATATFKVVQTPETPQALLVEDFEGSAFEVGQPSDLASDWMVSTTTNFKWTVGSVTGNKYLLADASNGTVGQDYEIWVISPALNLTAATDKKAAFHSFVGKYVSGSSLDIFLLDSKVPATTTPLTARIAAAADTTTGGESSWIPSGDIDLSAYTGTKYIGFRYKAKGTGGASGVKSTYYRIDNFTFGTTAMPLLSTTPASLDFVAAGEAKQIKIDGNVNWTISNSSATWCTLSTNSGTSGATTVTVTAVANTGGSRAGTLTISAGTLTTRVSVSQAASAILAEWDISTAVSGSYSLSSTNGASILSFTRPSGVDPIREIAKMPAYMFVQNWDYSLKDAWIFEVNPTVTFTGGNVRISVPAYANAGGPRDWKVQWSLTGTSGWTDATDATYTVTTGKTTKVKTMTIGTTTGKFYIRLVVDSDTNVGGTSGILGQSRLADKIIIEKL